MESTTTLLAWAGDHWFITIVALCQLGRFSNIFHFVTHVTTTTVNPKPEAAKK